MKICKDCVYFAEYTHNPEKWCKAPNLGKSPVTGSSVHIMARAARDSSSLCGLDAKWFKEKPLNDSVLRRVFRKLLGAKE